MNQTEKGADDSGREIKWKGNPVDRFPEVC
jgi:hypothetical protein